MEVERGLTPADKSAVRVQRGRLRVHGFEGRHGGVGMWCDLPVQMFPKNYRKVELNRAESA